MNTPRATASKSQPTRRYTKEEKEQILANFDLEVADRVSKFERYIEQILESFLVRHETEITRIPKGLRNMPVGEFMDKYNGRIADAMQGLTKAKMAEGGEPIAVEGTARKRKWNTSSQDGGQDADTIRPPKTARTVAPSPNKSGLSKTIRRPSASNRLGRTPTNTSRAAKARFHNAEAGPSKPPSRPGSPSKPSIFPSTRLPSSHFNPTLPKTPAFPRRLRKNESVVSLNGSPVANPLNELFLGTYRLPPTVDEDEEALGDLPPMGLRRPGADIIVRRDPSFRPSALSESQHSTATDSTCISSAFVVSVPTNRGQVIEFDALQHSPGALDRLTGVSDSAKKLAKEEMVRMVQAALDKWAIS